MTQPWNDGTKTWVSRADGTGEFSGRCIVWMINSVIEERHRRTSTLSWFRTLHRTLKVKDNV